MSFSMPLRLVDDNRIRLTPEPGVSGSDYINASPVRGFTNDREFIITQFPLLDSEVRQQQQQQHPAAGAVTGTSGHSPTSAARSTVADFWRMVFMYRLGLVVVFAGECSQQSNSAVPNASAPLDVSEWLRESLSTVCSEELELKLLKQNAGAASGTQSTHVRAGSATPSSPQVETASSVATSPTLGNPLKRNTSRSFEFPAASKPATTSSASLSTPVKTEAPTEEAAVARANNVAAAAAVIPRVSSAIATGPLDCSSTPLRSAENSNANASQTHRAASPARVVASFPSLHSERFALLHFELKSTTQQRSIQTFVLVVLESWPDAFVTPATATGSQSALPLPSALDPKFFDVFLLTRCDMINIV